MYAQFDYVISIKVALGLINLIAFHRSRGEFEILFGLGGFERLKFYGINVVYIVKLVKYVYLFLYFAV